MQDILDEFKDKLVDYHKWKYCNEDYLDSNEFLKQFKSKLNAHYFYATNPSFQIYVIDNDKNNEDFSKSLNWYTKEAEISRTNILLKYNNIVVECIEAYYIDDGSLIIIPQPNANDEISKDSLEFLVGNRLNGGVLAKIINGRSEIKIKIN